MLDIVVGFVHVDISVDTDTYAHFSELAMLGNIYTVWRIRRVGNFYFYSPSFLNLPDFIIIFLMFLPKQYMTTYIIISWFFKFIQYLLILHEISWEN